MDDRRIAIEAELSEARGAQLCIAHARTALPHRDACSLAIAGGYANFLGPRSPLSEAVGVGVAESAGIADVDRIVEFYIARGSVPRVVCGPHVDRALVEALRARGFVPTAEQQLLVADLHALDAEPDPRIAERTDAAAWARATIEALAEDEPAPTEMIEFSELLPRVPAVRALEGREGEAIVAVGCLDVDGIVAGFFAGATHPRHRGRGWQSALIRDRIARARDAGARYGRATVAPGSASHRNFRREGFVDAGTRTVWERRIRT